jgi:hypothetical protein
MDATSSQDEFAKWAKLRRQHDKVLAEYEEKGWFAPDTAHLREWHGILMSLACSTILPVLPGLLQHHGHGPPLARHQRPARVPTGLVFQATALLGAKGVGSVVRGMDPFVSTRADWEHQHPSVGRGMRKRDYHCVRCFGCLMGHFTAAGRRHQGKRSTHEDGCRNCQRTGCQGRWPGEGALSSCK